MRRLTNAVVAIPLAVLLGVGASGCRPDREAADAGAGGVRTTVAEDGEFSQRFELFDSIVPVTTGNTVLARISGVDMNDRGDIAIADASEGDVKIFGRDGAMRVRVGRKGSGPGEFQAPRYPRFGRDGRLFVLDPQANRLQVFSPSGEYQRGINLTEFTYAAGFEVMPDGGFTFASETAKNPEVLIRTDSAGTVVRRFLPSHDLRPTGEKNDPIWSSVRSFFLDLRGDTAYLVNTVSDTVWRVELPSGRVDREVVSFRGQVAPRAPETPLRDVVALSAWAKAAHMASTLSVGSRVMVVPFVQGTLNFGDPMVLLAREPGGGWKALRGAPPIIYARGDTLLGIMNPNEDQVRLGLYRWRGE